MQLKWHLFGIFWLAVQFFGIFFCVLSIVKIWFGSCLVSWGLILCKLSQRVASLANFLYKLYLGDECVSKIKVSS